MPQFKDLQRCINIGEFDDGGVIEEEVLGRRVILGQAGTLNAEDFESETARRALGVGEDEGGLVRVSRDAGIFRGRSGEEAVLQMWREGRRNLHRTFDKGEGLDLQRNKQIDMFTGLAEPV